jgi:hypothetical protein
LTLTQSPATVFMTAIANYKSWEKDQASLDRAK